jgi:predicted nucleic acid-binding protein
VKSCFPSLSTLNNSEAESKVCSKLNHKDCCSPEQHLKETQELLSGFAILDLDQTAVNVANQLKQQIKTSKRHADLIIAAQTIAGRHILVTRNITDFQDILPAAQLQNWIDDRIG